MSTAHESSFLSEPELSEHAQRLYDDDRNGLGYVMNASRLWAHQPALHDGLFDVVTSAAESASLTLRQRGILVTATASSLGDSYCSLAWGRKLANETDAGFAAGVLTGDDALLDAAERALARWARLVARDPNATTDADVQALRESGYDDAQILAITTYVALRLAFSSVNDALGARPDRELGESVPAQVREAVTFGRPVAE